MWYNLCLTILNENCLRLKSIDIVNPKSKCSYILNDSFRMVVVGLVIANVILTIAMIIDAVTMRGPIRVNGDLISSNEVIVIGEWVLYWCPSPEIGGHACPRLVRHVSVSAIFRKIHVRVCVHVRGYKKKRCPYPRPCPRSRFLRCPCQRPCLRTGADTIVRGRGCPCPPISVLAQ